MIAAWQPALLVLLLLPFHPLDLMIMMLAGVTLHENLACSHFTCSWQMFCCQLQPDSHQSPSNCMRSTISLQLVTGHARHL